MYSYESQIDIRWYDKCYIDSFEEIQARNPESSSLYVHSRENTLNYTPALSSGKRLIH